MTDLSNPAHIYDFPNTQDDAPLIPEGDYRFKLTEHETTTQFGTPKLILTFQLLDFGPLHGTRLKSYYNVERLIGKPGKKGKVKHKRTGDFLVEYFTILPAQPKPKRFDRIPLEPLYNSEIVCSVVTVKQNSKREPLPKQLWYSKVGHMVRINS